MEYTHTLEAMQETDLYSYWEYYAQSGEELNWNGNKLKIIQMGYFNKGFGPDITHSRFLLNNVIYQGSIEFHVNLNDWYLHQHDSNPFYKDVLLHILGHEPSSEIKTVSHKMAFKDIPSFVLKTPLFNKGYIKRCQPKKNQFSQTEALQLLALKRLNSKVSLYKKKLKSFSPYFIFYHIMLRVLGYPHNKMPFEMLAHKIPAFIYEKEKGNPDILLGLYLGSAGFLNKPFNQKYPKRLLEIYNAYQSILPGSPMNPQHWQISGIRSFNHPQYRIAGWVSLLTEQKSVSPFDYIYSTLGKRMPVENVSSALENYLSGTPIGYWRDHYALEKPLQHRRNRRFLGSIRIKELIINCIIPLCIAFAKGDDNLGFVSYLEDIFLKLPGKAEYSFIRKEMPWLPAYYQFWPVFAFGQACLELHEKYCFRHLCENCPINRH